MTLHTERDVGFEEDIIVECVNKPFINNYFKPVSVSKLSRILCELNI